MGEWITVHYIDLKSQQCKPSDFIETYGPLYVYEYVKLPNTESDCWSASVWSALAGSGHPRSLDKGLYLSPANQDPLTEAYQGLNNQTCCLVCQYLERTEI